MSECLLKQVEKKEINAKNFGFYWETMDQLIEQILSECREIQDADQNSTKEHLGEEIGDLMLATASLAVFCGFDPHQTMKNSLDKFQKRFDSVVKLTHQDGLKDLKDQPFEVLMSYWKKAKNSPQA